MARPSFSRLRQLLVIDRQSQIDRSVAGSCDIDESANSKIGQSRKIYDDTKPIKGFVSIVVKRKNGDIEEIQNNVPNLLTTAGRDWLIAQSYTNTNNGGRGAGYIALSNNSQNPGVTNTILTGEITNNGLARADASTKTHASGTNSIVISNVFSATGTVSNVHKAGLLTALTRGTLVNADAFTTDFTLQSGDSVTVIWNITFG